VRVVADVRTAPGSRKHPHFGRRALEASLAERGIRYVHLPELGGFRRALPDSSNMGLRNVAFRGYADHAATDEFARGYARLTELAREMPTAFMCAETLWWRCHRRILADRLSLDGWEVTHVVRAGKSDPHLLSPEARLVGGTLTYPFAVEIAGQSEHRGRS